MNFIHVDTYFNYIDANLVLGRLESEDINCWLRDENTVTIDPILTNAVGGIKLMVAETQVERAVQILNELKAQKKALIKCIYCGSDNVEFVSTPRKASNWFAAIGGFLFGDLALSASKVYHCFSCEKEFTPEELENKQGD